MRQFHSQIKLILLRYPAIGWEELVNIQAPKDRAWARDKNAIDLLNKCLEVRLVLQCFACNVTQHDHDRAGLRP